MGLDTSHDCWSGPYSSFHRWRAAVAKAIGIDLDRMQGFWKCSKCNGTGVAAYDVSPDEDGAVSCPECNGTTPMAWRDLPKRPLHLLLNHSDCDGLLKWEDCAAIADDLESILDDLEAKGPFSARECAARWIRGLRKAATAKENVEFS